MQVCDIRGTGETRVKPLYKSMPEKVGYRLNYSGTYEKATSKVDCFNKCREDASFTHFWYNSLVDADSSSGGPCACSSSASNSFESSEYPSTPLNVFEANERETLQRGVTCQTYLSEIGTFSFLEDCAAAARLKEASFFSFSPTRHDTIRCMQC